MTEKILTITNSAGIHIRPATLIAQNANKYECEVYRLFSPVMEISSNDIRRRVAEGESIRYLLPDSVAEYIREHGLYRKGSDE